MKKIAYYIGWFVDNVIINILLLLIWLPLSIIILPIGIFNPFKRKTIFWIDEYEIIGKDLQSEFRFNIICVWCLILYVFFFLFYVAPYFTLGLIGFIIIFVFLWYCVSIYKEKGKKK